MLLNSLTLLVTSIVKLPIGYLGKVYEAQTTTRSHGLLQHCGLEADYIPGGIALLAIKRDAIEV